MVRALVIGGGVAGSVAAMALQRAGITSTVHEAAAADAGDLGGWLGLQPNGLDALRAIDADQAVLDLGFPTSSIALVSGTGKKLGVMPVGSPRPHAEQGRTMKRAELYRTLQREARGRGIQIHHSSRLVDVSTAAAGVTATFADGTTESAELLIGADGVHSRVRGLLDPTLPAPTELPGLSIGGYSEFTPPGAKVGELTMVFGARAFFGYVAAPTGQTWWFANPPGQGPGVHEPGQRSDEEWRSHLRRLYSVDRTPAVDLMDATPGKLHAWKSYHLPRVHVQHDERMVLLGDAAHAVSPASGQGASLAIEDAVVLARLLRDQPAPDAFTMFQRVRGPRWERVVALGSRTDVSSSRHAVSRVLRDLLMPLALRRAARRGDRSVAWLHQHHIDWEYHPSAVHE